MLLRLIALTFYINKSYIRSPLLHGPQLIAAFAGGISTTSSLVEVGRLVTCFYRRSFATSALLLIHSCQD